MENTPPLSREEVAEKNDRLAEEHLRIAAAQHNANIVNIFANSPETIHAARKIVDNFQEIQDDHIKSAKIFAAENYPTLRLLAEEEDEIRQAFDEANKEDDERNKEAYRRIIDELLMGPFNRAALVGDRESIIAAYCAEKNIKRYQITGKDMKTIADMPEWIAAHPKGEGGYRYEAHANGLTTIEF